MCITADLGNSLGAFLAALLFRVLVVREKPKVQLGWWWSLAAALGLFVLISAIKGVTSDSFLNPRWLAHNVREFSMFPLMVLPWTLATVYFCEQDLRSAPASPPPQFHLSRAILWQLSTMTFILFAFLAWHIVLALSQDIGEMAQKPPFARGGRLSIQYLLAFHYFEHVLDYVFVIPLTILFHSAITLLSAHREKNRLSEMDPEFGTG
jgi:hypothetical protein